MREWVFVIESWNLPPKRITVYAEGFIAGMFLALGYYHQKFPASRDEEITAIRHEFLRLHDKEVI